MSTRVKSAKRAKYPSDISKNGWKRLKKMLPVSQYQQSGKGRAPADLKEVINAGHPMPFFIWSRQGVVGVAYRMISPAGLPYTTTLTAGVKPPPRGWYLAMGTHAVCEESQT
ncbi:MAG: hypothetical protein AAF632_24265 [Bacteroidota bacterium]